MTLQIVRDWVVKFNANGPDGLIDRKAPGQAPRLSEEHRKALAAKLESLGGVNVRFVSDIVKPRVSRPRKAAVEPAGASSSTEPMLSDNDPPTDDATSVEAITARNKSRRAA